MPAWNERICVWHAGPSPQAVRLREPCGADELALDGVDTGAAVRWLDALIDGPPAAAELSASDRDALLAGVHRALWSDRIVSSFACVACGKMVDLSFELSALQRDLARRSEAAQVSAPRHLHDHDGHAYTLPAAADEEAAAALGALHGRQALAGSIRPGADAAAVAARLEELAPLLDVELDAACAECGQAQQMRFDIQSFVLQRLLDERETLLAEVHALAAGHGWSLAEIAALPRGLRRAFAARLQAQTTPAATFG
jgi:hypothetical protein